MSTAIEQAKQTIEAVKQGKVLEPEMALRLATARAQVAQAEAAERQAAAAEKRNELAEQRNAKLERIAVVLEGMVNYNKEGRPDSIAIGGVVCVSTGF